MSDWQVGDLAVCVDDGDMGGFGPQSCAYVSSGRTYRVIGIAKGYWPSRFGAGLVLGETRNPYGPNGAFSELRFRKIRPDEHEACEPEFIQLLKRSKVTA